MKITKLRTQYLENPIGLSTTIPKFSYLLESAENNQYQTAYRILAASTSKKIAADEGDIWDCGKVESGETFAIEYNGKTLQSRQRVYWKVMVWDKNNQQGKWSETAYFETGLLNTSDWAAKWIGQGDEYYGDKSVAPMVATDFTINDYDNIVSARAYISGLGLYEASINGEKLGDTCFDPGESDFKETVYYVTYDITEKIKDGKNAIGIIIGNGQYVNYIVNPVMMLDNNYLSPKHRYQKNDSSFVKKGIYGEKKTLAQVEVTYKDGRTKIMAATNNTWKVTESPITFNNWYGGEDYDAIKEIIGWNEVGIDRTSWENASIMNAPCGKLKAREFNPIKIVEKALAVSVTELSSGYWLVDMGRNGAGFPEIILKNTTKADTGTKIQMYPAEELNDLGTSVDQSSCSQSWTKKYNCSIQDSYIVKGTGNEIWHPRFAYQGYRYIGVVNFPGIPTADNFNNCIVRTVNEKNGSFETSDKVMNAINTITERSIESNMFGAFTDCPQIEKLGWLETSHLMFNSMASSYDIRGWIPKIVSDIVDSQVDEEDAKQDNNEPVGYVPAIVPEYYRIAGLNRDPNWSGACILTPWNYFQTYGDKNILKNAYVTMTRYIDYLKSQTNGNLLTDYAQMGDWGQINELTPTVLVASCAYYNLVDTISNTADVLGVEYEKEMYRSLANEIKTTFHNNSECYNPITKVYGNGSQASYGCVLYSGIILDENITNSIDGLVQAVQERDYHLSSGEVGLKQVFTVLARYGRSDVVYKMVMNDTQPSYKYFIDNELTALPEYWNYEELWWGMVRSRNHAMMGHVKEWMTSSILGINPNTPGYRYISIKPYIPFGMKEVKGCMTCPYGKIEVHWNCDDTEKTLKMKVTIPVGSTANVFVPKLSANTVTIDGQYIDESITNDSAYFKVENIGSGTYTFITVV
jgi:alpha-L-rhamnosidase